MGNSTTRFVLMVVVLTLVVSACSGSATPPGATPAAAPSEAATTQVPAPPTAAASASAEPKEPTEPPTETASTGGGVFTDDFSDPSSGWPDAKDPGRGAAVYHAGRYVVDAVTTKVPVAVPSPAVVRPGNADVQMSVTVAGVPTTPGLAGLYCRASSDGDLKYTFAISEDRTWAIFKDVAGQVDVLEGGDASDILTDDHNELSARCLGPAKPGGRALLVFAINGETVAEVVDPDGLGASAKSGVGLLVNRDEGSPRPLSVGFDDFELRVGAAVARGSAGT